MEHLNSTKTLVNGMSAMLRVWDLCFMEHLNSTETLATGMSAGDFIHLVSFVVGAWADKELFLTEFSFRKDQKSPFTSFTTSVADSRSCIASNDPNSAKKWHSCGATSREQRIQTFQRMITCSSDLLSHDWEETHSNQQEHKPKDTEEQAGNHARIIN
jgi:hypothetical protein